MRYIATWARISSRKLPNCTHCIVEFECVSAQLYLVDDSQLQWRENISEKWTKKTSRIVKKCSIHECIFWFVPNPQGKDFDKSNQTSAEICQILIKKYNVQKGYCFFSINEKRSILKSRIIKNNWQIILVMAWWPKKPISGRNGNLTDSGNLLSTYSLHIPDSTMYLF